MTETELVEELHRLEKLEKRTRCEQMRLEIVHDELVGRQSNYRRMTNNHQYGV
ncbi:hypothetical protein ACFWNH_31000 [Rhodococcus qingshengii]|uniref:hypothetical protein n=1 Tax=Rhodococcus qingshengii TaxID=334542 RepID=UPI0036473B84